jgi:hypothetical protein
LSFNNKFLNISFDVFIYTPFYTIVNSSTLSENEKCFQPHDEFLEGETVSSTAQC